MALITAPHQSMSFTRRDDTLSVHNFHAVVWWGFLSCHSSKCGLFTDATNPGRHYPGTLLCHLNEQESRLPRAENKTKEKRLKGNAEFAGVDNAGVDNSAPCCRDGLCRSGQISTMWQGWTLQEWTMRHRTMWQGWTMREWTVQEWSNVY